ncbi:hypothetical protein FA13DRAFT_1351259 [Coprinellus micaceus]|uniref:Uncharacterized protein n=1 Tax=Coprinellus micaceus TaxID=71717 RepID=A0A4Y7TPR0_COPMI|nr:hypothetical protein FA13DRAFT_1351259 [Coprinellus micaceus]
MCCVSMAPDSGAPILTPVLRPAAECSQNRGSRSTHRVRRLDYYRCLEKTYLCCLGLCISRTLRQPCYAWLPTVRLECVLRPRVPY